MKRVRWRQQARDDAREAAAWYGTHSGLAIELAFIAAVEAAASRIAAHAALGSTRHAVLFPDLAAPLRFVTLERFERYLLHYLDLPSHVEVLRLWNSARGLDALMTDPAEPSP